MHLKKILIPFLFIWCSVSSTLKNIRSYQDLIGCQKIDGNGQCESCNFRYILKNGKCLIFNQICKSWSSKDQKCKDCFAGYSLQEGQCILQEQKAKSVSSARALFESNHLCIYWDINGVCMGCVKQAILIEKECVLSQCEVWNNTDGKCKQCKHNYKLINGICVVISSKQIITKNQIQNHDPLCVEQARNGACLQCLNQAIIINGTCVIVADKCLKREITTNECIDCYEGYQLDYYGECQKQKKFLRKLQNFQIIIYQLVELIYDFLGKN